MNGVQYAGDFKIEEAILISPTGSRTNLLTDVHIVEINIFVDIFKNLQDYVSTKEEEYVDLRKDINGNNIKIHLKK